VKAKLIAGLALATLFFAVLLPPEAYPNGRFIVVLCSTFVFLANLVERKIPPRYAWIGLGLFGLAVVHSLLVSVDAHRSIEFVAMLWAYYCLLGFFVYAGFEPIRPVAAAIIALSIMVSGYAVYQYFWGFGELYDFIFYSSSDQVFKTPALSRIADQRVFSTFALPGTLWGFLVVALPFHAALWGRNRYLNGLLGLSAALALAAGFLTRSFGFLLGLLTLAAVWTLWRHRRVVWNRFAAVAVLLLLAAGTFYAVRREVIASSNPLSLRFMNWVSAWSIFADNPLGAGFNTYGVMYPRYILPGANESQYAHNTPLQLLAEGGYPLVAAAVGLLLLGTRNWTRERLRTLPPFVAAAVAAWLVHNLIDINVYFPSIGIVGAVLAGALFHRRSATEYTPGRPLLAGVAAVSLAVISFSALNMVSSELQHRAKYEYEENRLAAAAATLEQAKRFMPFNSSLYHESGDILLSLYHNRREETYLTQATESFRRAIALSPSKSGPHAGLSLSLSSAKQVDAALEEIRIAQSLYPDSSYLQAVARLLENRRAATAN
jgi:tetratricopeptide (TPR) repeat protein